ncbi:hypothetical protein SK58_03848 [Enterobacter sp. BIDMC93]|nr:hypothetical protein SK58_03848 [Enterobacter sp. BIDMC93]
MAFKMMKTRLPGFRMPNNCELKSLAKLINKLTIEAI